MSIEEKKLDNAELSATINYIENKIESCKLVLKDNKKSSKEAIRDWAASLKRKSELGQREGPISLIASEIRNVCKKELGWTDNECDLIRHVLDEEFKDHRFDNKPKEGGPRSALENINNVIIDLNNIEDSIDRLSVNQLQDLYEMNDSIAIKIEHRSDEERFGLLRKPRSIHDEAERNYERKISIKNINVKTETDDKTTQDNFDKFIKSLSLFRDNFMKINKKMKRYPVTDDKVRENLNYYLTVLTTMFTIINNVLQPFSDDKRTVSPSVWNFLKGFLEHETLGGLASMIKQNTISGEPTKPSTKGIKKAFKNDDENKEWEKFEKLIYSDTNDFPMSLRWLIWQFGAWYNHSSSYSAVRATHKDDKHDKLSDSANWRNGSDTSKYTKPPSIDKLMEDSRKDKDSIS